MTNEPLKRQSLSGVPRLKAAYFNSIRGARDVWHGEEAYRMQAWILACALPVAVWLADSAFQASLLVGSIVMVMIVETLNTAIEAAIDRIGFETNELSRLAKDLGSWAVMLTMLLCGLMWLAAIWDAVFA